MSERTKICPVILVNSPSGPSVKGIARVVSVPNDTCLVISHRGRRHLAHQWERSGHVAAISSDDEGDLEVHWTWEVRDGEPSG